MPFKSRIETGNRRARNSKKGRRILCQRVRVKYAFIKEQRQHHKITTLCRVLRVNRSGYYAWLQYPMSKQEKERQRLTGLIKQAWLESGCVYGYHQIHDDLPCLGEHTAAKIASID